MCSTKKAALQALQAKDSAENLAANNGLYAATEGKPRKANPYPSNSFLHKHWDLGWLECHPDDFGVNSNE